eukprot:GCRY01004282.1.p1 GENE.GCRY01004282.1~~GCRY01004282.1.p1  ORF type:complete len:1160 (-),score=355.79 GCRY01004282.1:57-3536(-)
MSQPLRRSTRRRTSSLVQSPQRMGLTALHQHYTRFSASQRKEASQHTSEKKIVDLSSESSAGESDVEVNIAAPEDYSLPEPASHSPEIDDRLSIEQLETVEAYPADIEAVLENSVPQPYNVGVDFAPPSIQYEKEEEEGEVEKEEEDKEGRDSSNQPEDSNESTHSEEEYLQEVNQIRSNVPMPQVEDLNGFTTDFTTDFSSESDDSGSEEEVGRGLSNHVEYIETASEPDVAARLWTNSKIFFVMVYRLVKLMFLSLVSLLCKPFGLAFEKASEAIAPLSRKYGWLWRPVVPLCSRFWGMLVSWLADLPRSTRSFFALARSKAPSLSPKPAFTALTAGARVVGKKAKTVLLCPFRVLVAVGAGLKAAVSSLFLFLSSSRRGAEKQPSIVPYPDKDEAKKELINTTEAREEKGEKVGEGEKSSALPSQLRQQVADVWEPVAARPDELGRIAVFKKKGFGQNRLTRKLTTPWGLALLVLALLLAAGGAWLYFASPQYPLQLSLPNLQPALASVYTTTVSGLRTVWSSTLAALRASLEWLSSLSFPSFPIPSPSPSPTPTPTPTPIPPVSVDVPPATSFTVPEEWMEDLSGKIQQLSTHLNTVANRLVDLEGRVDTAVTATTSEMDLLRAALESKADQAAVEAHTHTLSQTQEQAAARSNEQLAVVMATVSAFEEQVSALTATATTLEQQDADAEERLSQFSHQTQQAFANIRKEVGELAEKVTRTTAPTSVVEPSTDALFAAVRSVFAEEESRITHGIDPHLAPAVKEEVSRYAHETEKALQNLAAELRVLKEVQQQQPGGEEKGEGVDSGRVEAIVAEMVAEEQRKIAADVAGLEEKWESIQTQALAQLRHEMQDMMDAHLAQLSANELNARKELGEVMDGELRSLRLELNAHFTAALVNATLRVQNEMESQLATVSALAAGGVDEGLLASKLTELQQAFEDKLTALEAAFTAPLQPAEPSAVNLEQGLTLDVVRVLIKQALETYAADRIARVDYALGATVLSSRTSPSYRVVQMGGALGPLFNVFIPPLQPPENALSADTSLGMCWPFAGASGYLTFQLSTAINATAVTIDHLPGSIARDITSAPREFKVWALADESDFTGELLGTFEYSLAAGRSAIQTFPLTPLSHPVRVVQVQILSNHGHSDYTCLYRVRLHADN